MPTPSQQSEQALLAAAHEDYTGLYEAVWELNTLFPDTPLGQKYQLAQDALTALLKKGLIRLERRTMAGNTPRYEIIPLDQAAQIFQNPTSWYPEYPENTQIGFSAVE